MAARYNSGMPLAGATLLYTAPKNWLFYGGADWSHDITKEAEQASVRKGVRLGMVKFFSDGLGLRANLRYTRRTFDAPGELVYRFIRKDRISGQCLNLARQNRMERFDTALEYALSANQQQYERLLLAPEHAMVCQRGKAVLKTTK